MFELILEQTHLLIAIYISNTFRRYVNIEYIPEFRELRKYFNSIINRWMSIIYKYECSIYFKERRYLFRKKTIINFICRTCISRPSNVINELFNNLYFPKAMFVYLCIPNFLINSSKLVYFPCVHLHYCL
jgi:hypothetical protein